MLYYSHFTVLLLIRSRLCALQNNYTYIMVIVLGKHEVYIQAGKMNSYRQNDIFHTSLQNDIFYTSLVLHMNAITWDFSAEWSANHDKLLLYQRDNFKVKYKLFCTAVLKILNDFHICCITIIIICSNFTATKDPFSTWWTVARNNLYAMECRSHKKLHLVGQCSFRNNVCTRIKSMQLDVAVVLQGAWAS